MKALQEIHVIKMGSLSMVKQERRVGSEILGYDTVLPIGAHGQADAKDVGVGKTRLETALQKQPVIMTVENVGLAAEAVAQHKPVLPSVYNFTEYVLQRHGARRGFTCLPPITRT